MNKRAVRIAIISASIGMALLVASILIANVDVGAKFMFMGFLALGVAFVVAMTSADLEGRR